MVALKGDKEIGDKINKIISALAEENNLKGVIDVADFNDEDRLGKGKEMVDRLSNLVAIFDGLDLSANRAEGDDLLGDAYEYLMRHFATESGKSKGQFYTPAEVSRVLAKVVGITADTRQDQTVYDPTCGSGSLLLKVVDEAPRGLSIFGQEYDNATAALARMNMILHGNPTAEIEKNDYNLNIPRYIDSSEPEDLHDLSAHLNGGIPNGDIDALGAYWRVFPKLRRTLFASSDRPGYSESLVEATQVKATILNHEEFVTFADRSLTLYLDWYKTYEPTLKEIAIGDKPKVLIATLSEDLLARFAKADLLDKYDIYQLLMDYWAETMQDDVYYLGDFRECENEPTPRRMGKAKRAHHPTTG
jgi:hypothetical protein